MSPMVALCGLVPLLFGLIIFWCRDSSWGLAMFALGTALVLPFIANCVVQYQPQ